MSTFAAQQQQQSSRLSSLLPQSFGFSPYDAASNPTSPSPFDAFQYPQRPVSPHTEMQHQLLARLTTSAAGLSSSVNASVLRDPTSSYAGHSSSSAKGLSELPTPPSSSSGQPSATSLRPRTPTPPLPAPPPPPSHSLSQPALSLRRPVAQNQVLSAPLLKGTGRQSSSAAAAAAISSVQLLQQQQQQQREQQQQQQQEQQQRQHQQQQQQRQQQFQQQQEQHRQQQEQQRQQQSYHSHPAHPGPISLPPPSAFPLPPPHTISPMSPVHQHPQISPMHHPMLPSPLHHPMHYYQHSPLHHPALSMTTPHGLPPITPSMPSFQFAPGSGIPFSPGPAMSPGAFWGRPGGGANPGINAAVGAPVRAGGDGGEDYFMGMGMGMSMSTMPSMPSVESGYFPPFGSVGGSGLANEILRGTEGSADDRAENLRTSLNGNGHREGTTKSRSRSRSRSAGPPSEKGSAPRGRGEREVDGVDGLIERMGGLGAAHPQPRVPPPDVFWSGGADDGDKPPAPAPALHRSGSDPVQQAQHEQGQARPLSTGTSAGGAAS
ncbi:hypothetical protein BV25DRAFT_1642070 [Artomyces pyxidatus]|uniref:Uncharacterized protein n=1 Tax=Artomyces pyxidatus TaxID=48021 RepID=A0ACB8SJ36_9AGAM|nr:hypothetical protein BV25DRAFT_1642070 [Artomyces pyxidatus]